ncbi:hypothetical protein CKO28_20505 [Rhodovibrio sodomensis]|uniref:Uncharacterized protein n=1 Tax=Rhodovibrio sodomensis TaxID=1088 RepID=A0ABS1DJM0_9PROT|nr:hypothetical protein [Rhodovibrio sodomensis]
MPRHLHAAGATPCLRSTATVRPYIVIGTDAVFLGTEDLTTDAGAFSCQRPETHHLSRAKLVDLTLTPA